MLFQHTAARRRLVHDARYRKRRTEVSTHSRPKAAGCASLRFCVPLMFQHTAARRRLGGGGGLSYRYLACFNTQPPEGGWVAHVPRAFLLCRFNTQPPEGGWIFGSSTRAVRCCFNTQPPEGGWQFAISRAYPKAGFNTQPPEGGWFSDDL